MPTRSEHEQKHLQAIFKNCRKRRGGQVERDNNQQEVEDHKKAINNSIYKLHFICRFPFFCLGKVDGTSLDI